MSGVKKVTMNAVDLAGQNADCASGSSLVGMSTDVPRALHQELKQV